ncbi:hypothetical protein DFAR_1540052 [Desulfarculales bacterium]
MVWDEKNQKQVVFLTNHHNWTASVALLLLRWLHHLSLTGWSLSNLAAMLRLNLFTHRELRAWLQHTPITPRLSCPNRSSYRSCPDLDRQSPVKQKTSAQNRWPYLKNC